MRYSFFVIGLLLGMLGFACEGPKPTPLAPKTPKFPEAPSPKPTIHRGQLVSAEPIQASPLNSYAYYLPAGKDSNRPMPVLIFFDSHARGKDPVGMYRGLADQYGLFLVGSNVSKNGQQPNQAFSIYDQLLADLRLKFQLDESRISVSGFSGGARVAANLAQSRPAINTVIACAAGFQPRQGDTFNYYAIVGKKDFNYQELRQLEDLLDGTAQPHIVQYWEGGHEWPAADVMADAVEFLALRSMTANTIERDSLVKAVRTRFEQENRGKTGAVARWRNYKTLIAKLEGLDDVSAEKQQNAMTRSGKAWADDRAAEDAAMNEEMALRNEYVPLIGTKTVAEWRSMVNKLNPSSKPAGSNAFYIRHRVLNFLSLNVYFQVDGALKAGDLAAADHFLQIYELVDPTNPEHAYLTAVLRARQNHLPEAIVSLQKAKRIGFKDADRMAADPDLAALRTDQQFVDLLAELRAL